MMAIAPAIAPLSRVTTSLLYFFLCSTYTDSKIWPV